MKGERLRLSRRRGTRLIRLKPHAEPKAVGERPVKGARSASP